MNYLLKPAGQKIMADLVVYLFESTIRDLQLGLAPFDAEDERRRQAPLPEPMIRGNYEQKGLACFTDTALNGIKCPSPRTQG